METRHDFVACKVCGRQAPFWDACDFNTHCERAVAPQLFAPGGSEVPYYRCTDCGFLFTPAMDGFSREDFSARI